MNMTADYERMALHAVRRREETVAGLYRVASAMVDADGSGEERQRQRRRGWWWWWRRRHCSLPGLGARAAAAARDLPETWEMCRRVTVEVVEAIVACRSISVAGDNGISGNGAAAAGPLQLLTLGGRSCGTEKIISRAWVPIYIFFETSRVRWTPSVWHRVNLWIRSSIPPLTPWVEEGRKGHARETAARMGDGDSIRSRSRARAGVQRQQQGGGVGGIVGNNGVSVAPPSSPENTAVSASSASVVVS